MRNVTLFAFMRAVQGIMMGDKSATDCSESRHAMLGPERSQVFCSWIDGKLYRYNEKFDLSEETRGER